MSDSSNGNPFADENKDSNPSPETPRLPRIAPPEGMRAARGQMPSDDAASETEVVSDASIDPEAHFPMEELESNLEPPMGISIEKSRSDFYNDDEDDSNDTEAERYRVSNLREDTPRDVEIGLMEHLNELRVRLLWSFLSVFVGMCITWTYGKPLQEWFARPIREVLEKPATPGATPGELISTTPMGFFTIAFQFSLVSAIILVMPFILFQAWRFIEPALTNSERRYTLVLVPFSTALFFMGAGLGFFVSPLFFKFFLQFQPDGVSAKWDYLESIVLMAKMLLVFGVAFQVPIVVIFGVKVGILTRDILIQYWRHAVVVIFIVCAVLTPTWDPVTLGICATPPCLLYALSIWIVKYM